MSFDTLGDLDWLAVTVAAIAYFAIGAAWYAPPVFGRIWMAAGGITTEQAGEGPEGRSTPCPCRQPAVGDRHRHAGRGDRHRHAR